MSATNITIRESTSTPRTKPHPQKSSIPVPFDYCPSDDGTDENLLILLHGLGDTHVPFGRLGRSFKLPQTATLALRAPDPLPYLEEEAYEWYTSFNLLGELVRNPNPTPAADLLMRVFAHLTTDCSWPPNRIHMFGFAQGGTVAAEVGIKWWRTELEKLSKEKKDKAGETSEDTKANEPGLLGSIVSVCGPLISYPTLQNLCPTPILILHRPAPAETALPSGALSAFKKGYSNVTDLQMGRGEGMPRSRTEWEPIMRFWSERLGKRQMDGLYEVMSGITPA